MKFLENVVVIIVEDWYKNMLGRSGVGAELYKFAVLRMRKTSAPKSILIPCRMECLCTSSTTAKMEEAKIEFKDTKLHLHITGSK